MIAIKPFANRPIAPVSNPAPPDSRAMAEPIRRNGTKSALKPDAMNPITVNSGARAATAMIVTPINFWVLSANW